MMSDAAMFEIPRLADGVDAGDDTEEESDGDSGRINAPHSHAVWIIELRGGKHSRADIKEFLWDKYRCTPKGNAGLWLVFEGLSCWQLVCFILYCMKFPGGSCGQKLHRVDWRQWLSLLGQSTSSIFLKEIRLGKYKSTAFPVTPVPSTYSQGACFVDEDSERMGHESQQSWVHDPKIEDPACEMAWCEDDTGDALLKRSRTHRPVNHSSESYREWIRTMLKRQKKSRWP